MNNHDQQKSIKEIIDIKYIQEILQKNRDAYNKTSENKEAIEFLKKIKEIRNHSSSKNSSK